MAVLNAIPGDPLANSYTTVEYASAFLTMHLGTDAWDTATPEEQVAALQWATRLLDEQIWWYGRPTTTTQALAWPQTGQVDRWGRVIPADSVPAVVQQATALYALSLLESVAAESAGATPGTGELILKSKKIGDTTITYQDVSAGTVTTLPVAPTAIPSDVRRSLWPYGQIPGMGTVPVVRT